MAPLTPNRAGQTPATEMAEPTPAIPAETSAKPDPTPAQTPVADAGVAQDPMLTEPGLTPDEDPAPEIVPPGVQASDLPAPAIAPIEADEPLLRPMAEADAPPPAAVGPDLPLPEEPSLQPITDPAPEAMAQIPEPEILPQDEDQTVIAALPEAVEPDQLAPEQPDLTQPDLTEPALDPIADSTVITAPPEVTPAPLDKAAPQDPEPSVTPEKPALPSTLALDGGLGAKTVDGVTTGRLPSIGTSAAPDAAPATADLPPVQRFARRFDNPEAKPLFAILLLDPGTADLNRAELAALPFPVTFVLDPMIPGASDAESIYRAAGQEVVMLATGIPKGAKASDLEQSFASLDGSLPQSVALIDTATAAFQDDRGLAAEVVTLLADQGRGLVTFDRGLNAADQVARRENLPAATIFRSLDDDGEDAPLIRRYLDRAAFKAAQEGSVVVIGTAREATVTALLEWAVEGRAASVALAPITAVMAAR